MRYWIYENRRVSGPFDAKAAANMPGFQARSLVCPETRSGDSPGDWFAAETAADFTVPEIDWRLRTSNNRASIDPEDEAICRVLASLEMRLLRLETGGQGEPKQNRELASLKETVAGLVSARDANDAAQDGAVSALRATSDTLRERVERSEARAVKRESEFQERLADCEEGLRRTSEARSGAASALEKNAAAIQRALEELDGRVGALDLRLSRSDAGLAAKLVELTAAVQDSKRPRESEDGALAKLSDAIERLSRGVSNVQSRMTGVEERKTGLESVEAGLEALGRSAAQLRASVARMEEVQSSLATLGELKGLLAQVHLALAAADERRAGLDASVREIRALLDRPREAPPAQTLGPAAPRFDGIDKALRELGERLARLQAAPRLEGIDYALRELGEKVAWLAQKPAAVAAVAAPAAAPSDSMQRARRLSWRDATLGLAGLSAGLLVASPAPPARVAPSASPPAAVAAFSSGPRDDGRAAQPQGHAAEKPPQNAPAQTAPAGPEGALPPPSSPSGRRPRGGGPGPGHGGRPRAPAAAREPSPPGPGSGPPGPGSGPPGPGSGPPGGEPRLLSAIVARDGVTLTLSSMVEPSSEFLESPFRLVVELPGARDGLWNDDIPAWPPHIREVRLAATEPGLRLTIYLDERPGYQVTRKGAQVLVRFLY